MLSLNSSELDILQKWADGKNNVEIANSVINNITNENPGKFSLIDLCFAFVRFDHDGAKHKLYEIFDREYENEIIKQLAKI